jgi:hypothetical protein
MSLWGAFLDLNHNKNLGISTVEQFAESHMARAKI